MASMSRHYNNISELPYIDLDRIEELRRQNDRCCCNSRGEKLYQRNCMDYQYSKREGCIRERRGYCDFELDELREDDGCIHGIRFYKDSNLDQNYDLGFEKNCNRLPILHSNCKLRTMNDSNYYSNNGNNCIYCNASLERTSNTRERDFFNGQDRRVHSYSKQCLSEDSDTNDYKDIGQEYNSDYEYRRGQNVSRNNCERQFSDEYSDLSEDMEVVIKRNNRNVISLALNWISLSGEHNKKIRKFVMDSMNSIELKDLNHFIILFQYDDHKGIRGLYSFFQKENNWQCVVEIVPNCPKVIRKEMVHTLYKFDTSQKLFKPINRSKKITDIVDGLSIKNEYLSTQ
ncbi:hypothetical protein [Cryptosporidium parvum Iowa II]|uniref:CKK domain-containing protein n=2 Tax=Cryptosporidium parvum TaxID=5807 RepID=Q5CWG6_CRYPI|nr:hypothetical protein [Cryptosporidium parvum Iowa II]QOY41404.1 Microtubule-binding calmodulin-regulated spectrin-associated protein [Cryptosporidium parvum]WKS78634.1 hypothetical protein CPCDC_6g5160 [Cryptosporidium sp. 43IA8]EAK90089.1 hypothetical protein cgd6_5160 [Cryptosporidium parvum Iowa II]WRK33125.1 Microtubule-binding calmodulin-regulated spectrin-associated protein [Cryptosporidium parvum]CAD98333.1 hypothetical predicted protein, unknown function [Cryptosporidium parvum]|eukprot:QOY41404.1 hypothetical protein CPATCC_003108 [Cryptosporidium parvum]